jgi:hypothetical protein
VGSYNSLDDRNFEPAVTVPGTLLKSPVSGPGGRGQGHVRAAEWSLPDGAAHPCDGGIGAVIGGLAGNQAG